MADNYDKIYAKGTGCVNKTIFIPSFLIIVAVAIILSVNPNLGQSAVKHINDFITFKFGWLFLLTPIVCLGFLIWLCLSPYGKVKFGTEPPEFSYFSWISMLFCCGVGSSIIIWGVAEPIYYVKYPPLGLEPYSTAAYEIAHTLPMVHWGLPGWAIYSVASLSIAHFVFVKKEPYLKMSSACQGVLGSQSQKWPGTVLEILVVLGTVGGFGTSLGLGVPFISTFFSQMFGVPDTMELKCLVILLWTLLFSLSVFRGLSKGMRLLSSLNVWLVFGFLIFVFVAGPTIFTLDMTVNSLGNMFSNFFDFTLSSEPLKYARAEDGTLLLDSAQNIIREKGTPQDWTIFYWCWYVALAPISGIFFGRISRGRTIRETAIGICFWGSLGVMVTLSVLSSYSLFLQYTGQLDIATLLTQKSNGVVAATVIATLPGAKVLVPLCVAAAMVFLATTLDAASFTLASVCTRELRGDQQPARWHRLLWAITLGVFSVGLLITGGEMSLKTVQTSAVAVGLPLLAALVLMAVSFVKDLIKNKSE